MTDKGPMFSVCIPVYNGKKYISEAIMSGLSQSDDVEVVVQDNASDDGTWELLESMSAKYNNLSIERNASNLGMVPNFNKVVKRARGDYIVVLGSDDYLEPGFISECYDVFKRMGDKVDFVSTSHYFAYERSDNKDEWSKKERALKMKTGLYHDFTKYILMNNPFSLSFTLFSRRAFDRLRVNGDVFASDYYTFDYDTWIRAALSGLTVYYLNRPLGTFRIHKDNTSHQFVKLTIQVIEVLLSHGPGLKKKANIWYRLTMLRYAWILLKIRVKYDRSQKYSILKILREALF